MRHGCRAIHFQFVKRLNLVSIVFSIIKEPCVTSLVLPFLCYQISLLCVTTSTANQTDIALITCMMKYIPWDHGCSVICDIIAFKCIGYVFIFLKELIQSKVNDVCFIASESSFYG